MKCHPLMTLNVPTVFPSDLLALDKGHLHSRVPQLLAGQVCFGEHDRESIKDITIIVSFNNLFFNQHLNDFIKARHASHVAEPADSFSITATTFHRTRLYKPLCSQSFYTWLRKHIIPQLCFCFDCLHPGGASSGR